MVQWCCYWYHGTVTSGAPPPQPPVALHQLQLLAFTMGDGPAVESVLCPKI